MRFWLVMRTTTGEERRFAVDKPRMLIGSENRCDVRIPIPAVDRRHCEIVLDNGDLLLTDLGSSCGTFHNGLRVESVRLSPADEVTVGPVTFTIRAQQVDEAGGPVSEVEIRRLPDMQDTADGGRAESPSLQDLPPGAGADGGAQAAS